MYSRWLSVALFVFFLGCQESETQIDVPDSVFFLVRHAEKADESEDPPLSDLGLRRAEALQHMLRDSGIGAIYSSDFIRTRDTAAPLAEQLGIEVVLYDQNRLGDLAADLLVSPGRYLIVGHTNTTPELVRLLGGAPGSEIGSEEYDRLYVLVRRPGGRTTTTLLRFEPVQESRQ